MDKISYIGIDPGLRGCAAVLMATKGEVVSDSFIDIPVMNGEINIDLFYEALVAECVGSSLVFTVVEKTLISSKASYNVGIGVAVAEFASSAVMKMDHTVSGMRKKRMPGARIVTIVVM